MPMPAQYDFRKKPSFKDPEQSETAESQENGKSFYPQIVSKGTLSFQELAEQISRASSFKTRM